MSPHLRGAIESVLRQRGATEAKLLIIEKGAATRTAELLESFRCAAITHVQASKDASLARCHNLAIENSDSALITHVEPTGILLPEAFARIADRWKSQPDAGLIHGYSFPVDDSGRSTREVFRERRAHLLQTRKHGMDYRWHLLFSEHEIDAVRVYSRKALEEVGLFRDQPGGWTEYDMALRIADRFPIAVVPEMIYAFRTAVKRPVSRIGLLRGAIRRVSCCHSLRRSGEVSFLRPGAYSPARHLTKSLWDSLGLRAIRDSFDRTAHHLKSFHGTFFWKWFVPFINGLYLRFAGHFPRWPVNLFRSSAPSGGPRKLAYYTWRFPILSQTFVHRELAALKRSGTDLLILADEPDDLEMADHNARFLLGQTEYLNTIDANQLRRYKRYFLYRNPLLYINLLLFLMTRRYRDKKNVMDDAYTFSRAVALAGALKDRNVDHVHVPWADHTALLALLASRLAGITYSVQARAHDVHRTSYLFGLREKLANAEFVVTNTVYNRDYLRQLLGSRNASKVHLIHNGLDLDRFTPRPPPLAAGSPSFKILCVARLIEQKGLTYLLHACSLLLEKGLDVCCEIIGAPEEPEYTNYYLELKLLHKKLALGDRVKFSGALPFAAILEKYADADLFVLPCVIAADGSRDITPNALIEAMAMGLCVISTPVTGVPEIVEDGVSGILAPPGDAIALADVIGAALKDPETRARMGRAAREKVERKFDVNRNIASYVELFSRIGTSRKELLPAVSVAPDRVVV